MKYLIIILLFIGLLCAPAVCQNTDITNPRTVTADGVPPIPTSLVKEMSQYRLAVATNLLAWDEKSREVITHRYNSIVTRTLPDGTQKPVANLLYGASRVLYHPRGKYLVVMKDQGGNEMYQLYRYDLESKQMTLLTDGASRNLYAVWSNSGDWLFYSSTRRDGKAMDIYAVNPLDPKSDHLVGKFETWDNAVFDLSDDDGKALVSDYRSSEESYLYLLDVKTGEKTLITPGKKGEKIFNGTQAEISKDGKGVFHITDRDSDVLRLAYLDLSTRKYRYLTQQWNVEEFDLSPDGKTIAYVANEEGSSRLHLINSQSGKELASPDLPRGVISSLVWHNNSEDLAFDIDSSRAPSTVFSVNVPTNKVESWGRAAEAKSIIADPAIIKWKGFDGLEISGYLYTPPSSFGGKRPVYIYLHGGPAFQARPTYQGEFNYLVSGLGIAMIFPNVRGSSGFGKRFQSLDNGTKREGAIKDIGALLDWIKTRPELDSSRVVIGGESYGGYLSLAAATRYSDRLKGSVSYLGMPSLVDLLENPQIPVDEFRAEFGDERDKEVRAYLEKISPTNNLRSISVPLLLIYGTNDRKVPFQSVEKFVKELKSQNKSYWYIAGASQGHGLTDPLAYQYASAVKAFFIKSILLESAVKADPGSH
jgi:dipeptidyl aminopeptidase/acylaminoacyl peptidase